MEIFWYLWLLILAVFFYLKPNFIKNEKLFFIIWFTVACFTLLIVRLNDIDVIYGNKGGISDIGDYALAMKLTLTRMLGSNLIYIREPVVWFSLKGLYSLTNNELITFLVIDFISLYFLFRGMNSYKKFLDPMYRGNGGISIDIRYIYFGLFLFFPFALGMHSIYRQGIATIFSICAIGYTLENKSFKSFLTFMVALLSHNISILCLPIIFYFAYNHHASSRNKKRLLIAISTIVPLILLSFIQTINFNDMQKILSVEVGQNIAYIYVAFLFMIFMFILLLSFTQKIKGENIYIIYSFYLFLVSALVSIILSSGAAERIGIYLLALLLPILVIFIETRIRQRIIMRFLLLLFLCLPSFTYYQIF